MIGIYTRQELGEELYSMVQEFQGIEAAMAAGEITNSEALQRVAELYRVDRFGAKWSIDPLTRQFKMVAHNGAVSGNAEPRQYQPPANGRSAYPDQRTAVEDAPSEVVEVEVVKYRTKWWKVVVGVVAGVLAGGAGGAAVMYAVGDANQSAAVVEAVERPTMPAEGGPSSDRIAYVLRELQKGNADAMAFVVQDEIPDDVKRWALMEYSVTAKAGYGLYAATTADGVSVLEVRDGQGNVLSRGDAQWVQNGQGQWILKEVPLLLPVSVEPKDVSRETSASQPAEPTGDAASEAAEGTSEPTPTSE